MELFEAIAQRRDTRHFIPGIAVPDKLLKKIFAAASMAPSVGLSRPGRYVIISSLEKRTKILDLFKSSRDKAESKLDQENEKTKSRLHRQLKLEGIIEAPHGLLVFCEYPTTYVLGASEMPKALEYSVACAIQNIWLALTAEGYGLGWVSFFQEADIASLLDTEIPKNWLPMGYLCLGKPATDYAGKPMLENLGWSEEKEAHILDEKLKKITFR